MKTVKVTVGDRRYGNPSERDQIEIPAFWVGKLFAVHRPLKNAETGELKSTGATITHIPTGLSVNAVLCQQITMANARKIAKALEAKYPRHVSVMVWSPYPGVAGTILAEEWPKIRDMHYKPELINTSVL